MANRAVVTIMALGLFVMAIGLFMPPLIDAQDNELRDTEELDEGQEVTVNELVTIQLNEANPDGGTANINVTIIDVATFEETTIGRLNVTNSTTVAPAGDNVTITNDAVVDGDTAQVTLSFSRTYGWEETAITFLNNVDLLLVLVGVLMILGSVLRVVD